MPVSEEEVKAAALDTAGDPLWTEAGGALFSKRMEARKALIQRHLEAAAKVRESATAPLPDIAGLLALKEGLPEGPWERDGACVFKVVENGEGRRGNRFYLYVWPHREFGGSPAEAETIARAIAALPTFSAALQRLAEERDAIQAKTIEECLAVKAIIPQKAFAEGERVYLEAFQDGIAAQIEAIRALAKT